MKVARLALGAVLLVGITTPANAAMDVQTFLAKVTALKAKGMGALFSSDIGLLKRESKVAVTAIQRDKAARKAAGKPPLYCAPEKERKMGADEMIAGLSAIPPAERGMPLRDGFLRVIRTKYPCR